MICPYCKSENVIKRGIRKNLSGDIRIYGCNDCKRRFKRDVDLELMANHVKELEIANQTLLNNNVKLVVENKCLSSMVDVQHSRLLILDKEKQDCKLKCEIIVKEKDRKLQEKEAYIASLHETVWHLKNSFACKFYNFHETPQGFKLEFEFHRK